MTTTTLDLDLPPESILYVSVTVSRDHPLHGVFRSAVEPGSELDLARIVASTGGWVRRYFAARPVDAAADPAALPTDLAAYRGVVIGGSSHTWASEGHALAPWQREVVDFVRYAIIDRGLPFLGLCGGGQIGVLALGGRVAPNPPGLDGGAGMLLRTGTVTLTDEGRADPIFAGCPPVMRMQEAHSHYFAGRPPGTRELARSADLGNQVIAYGDRVRLFQPHPELTDAYLRRIIGEIGDHALRQAAAALEPTLDANDLVVRNFLARICARGADAG